MAFNGPPSSTIQGAHTPPKQQRDSLNEGERFSRGRIFYNEMDSSSQKIHEPLLPAFSTQQYNQLPTPQSPSDRFTTSVRHSPESPLPQFPASNTASGSMTQRLQYRSLQGEANSSQHILTPASSPFNPRNSFRYDNPATPTNQASQRDDRLPGVSSILVSPVTPGNVPSSAPASTLSSPFMARAVVPGKQPQDQPPLPATERSAYLHEPRIPGGEMERIRQAMQQDHLTQVREAESRRPEYLKRAKRPLDETDPEDVTVGIMDSPNKGRRIKLFQETSEESFEESLMAGGYGRYRTADWVRQPQPISLPLVAAPGASTIISQLERTPVPDVPPTEKDIKKQQRLAVFRSARSDARKVRLHPVNYHGTGRVIVDPLQDLPQIFVDPSIPPVKKRNTRRKKKGPDTASINDRQGTIEGFGVLTPEDFLEKPNWPDAEFPWALREQERAENAKAEEDERLKWIERFLDREDSDDESEVRTLPPPARVGATVQQQHVWGRGKMVPLLAHPEDPRKNFRFQRANFPSDPGDAKAALLAKRSVRALSYRQQRRLREMHDDEEDMELCICNGVDDGRELVQCDGCQTWYHLECIGITDIAQLGREEDAWFCRRCYDRDRSRSPSPEPHYIPLQEPIFVPTDEAPRARTVDTPFFHQPFVHDSPNWLRVPKTPTRSTGPVGSLHDSSDYDAPSSSSWTEYQPSTPQTRDRPVHIHTSNNTPDGNYPVIEESPFDPTSTPSRGIRFHHAPYATPKTNMWPRPNYTFQTPLRGPQRPTHHNTGSIAVPEEAALSRCPPAVVQYDCRYHPQDESPVRRNASEFDGHPTRRGYGSPPPVSARLLDESPVMRVKSRERLDLGGARFIQGNSSFHS